MDRINRLPTQFAASPKPIFQSITDPRSNHVICLSSYRFIGIFSQNCKRNWTQFIFNEIRSIALFDHIAALWGMFFPMIYVLFHGYIKYSIEVFYKTTQRTIIFYADIRRWVPLTLFRPRRELGASIRTRAVGHSAPKKSWSRVSRRKHLKESKSKIRKRSESEIFISTFSPLLHRGPIPSGLKKKAEIWPLMRSFFSEVIEIFLQEHLHTPSHLKKNDISYSLELRLRNTAITA